MKNFLGPSWKPRLAAILTLIGPAGLLALLTTCTKMPIEQATELSGGVFIILTSFGLYNAKQHDVSNSPTPLVIAQPVIPPMLAVPVPTVPIVMAPVEVIIPEGIGSHVIPVAPYSVTGMATWFGLNPDGSDDKGDMTKAGVDLKGAFGDITHTEQLVGISIPIPIFRATIGCKDSDYKDVADRRYLFDVWCHSTGKQAIGVWLVDLGPNASENRTADMTYGLATLLGLKDNAIITWACTDTKTGKVLEIKGYDFVTSKVDLT